MESLYLGGGCFWCLEAVFQDLKGVDQVISGYMGGKTEDPTYKEVCSGYSGHAEIVKVLFDPEIIDTITLLEVFFATHDPTTLNRQGNDVGTQYRSVVFYQNEEQRMLAEKAKSSYATNLYSDPIITEISEATTFYAAEGYHQNYYKNNPSQGYCTFVVGPKVAKARSKFSQLMKS